uniref:Uncharacterized protein n=1 Tax=Melopsittacus undulatus TaxID=13146 RepID=A0A8C6JSL1_MELUD
RLLLRELLLLAQLYCWVLEVQGTWMGSVTLPCTYMPSDGFTQQTLIWSMERDHSTSTIFRRDYSGDHILLSQFRNRVNVPKHSPGDASLLIENLEIPDSGHYTCQVIWRTKNNTAGRNNISHHLLCLPVAATKPIIRAGKLGLTVPTGARTSLTCVASGSPPISYRWFRGTPGQKALLLSRQAELVWDSLQPSDTGKYYCEAENRAGAGAVQQSDAVELTVTGESSSSNPPAMAFTTSLGNPFQYLTTLTVKNFFLRSNLNLCCLSFNLLPLVLSLHVTESQNH